MVTVEAYLGVAPGAPPGCEECGQLTGCICHVRGRHALDCSYLRAAESFVEVQCHAHGFRACTVCNPCDCDSETSEDGVR